MDISQNYFELFQLPLACRPDPGHLALKYRELQKAVHPDRFAGGAERQQRLAVQYAAYVNEAFATLKDPLKRFIYLLSLAGRTLNREQTAMVDPAFLMAQMALRERLAELADNPDPQLFRQLTDEVEQALDELADEFARLWSRASPEALDQAEKVVQKMQFMVKVAAELEPLDPDWLD